MVETFACPAELLELLPHTHRLWLRTVLLGFGGYTLGGIPHYWRWDRASGEIRTASMMADRKLMREASRELQRDVEHGRVLAWKPESRMVWRSEYEQRWVCRKLLRSSLAGPRAQQARWLSTRMGKHAPRLLDIDAQGVQTWEWVEDGGKAPRNPEHLLRAVAAILPTLHLAGASAPPGLRICDHAEIIAHVEGRLGVMAAWLPFLPAAAPLTLQQQSEIWGGLRAELESLASGDLAVVHGDLRSRNLLSDASGAVRLVDADHLALAAPEWDWAALLTDLGLPAAAAPLPLHARRLSLYMQIWRLLFSLQALEEVRA